MNRCDDRTGHLFTANSGVEVVAMHTDDRRGLVAVK